MKTNLNVRTINTARAGYESFYDVATGGCNMCRYMVVTEKGWTCSVENAEKCCNYEMSKRYR